MSRVLLAPTLAALALTAACSVDTTDITTSSTTGAGGETATASSGGASTTGSTTNGTGGATTASSGGAGQGGGAGTGGGSAECPPITVIGGVLAECTDPGPFASSVSNTTLCPADTSVAWPAKIYAVPVTAGDCLHMLADNAGSPAGADLFGAIVDPSGHSLLFDEEVECTVTNPDGYACPAGGTTIETSGTAYVVVGSWEGAGCPAGDTTPFQLSVSNNGVDVALGAELCAGDLQEIIP